MTTAQLKDRLTSALSLASKAVVAAATAALPILGVIIIKQAFSWGVAWVIGQLSPFLTDFLVGLYVDMQVDAQRDAYTKARDQLQIVLEQTITDPTEQQNASDEFDKKLADLIHMGGGIG